MLASIAIVLVPVILSFSPILLNGFLGWDDGQAIVSNPHIQTLTLDNLRWMWTTFHMGPYQPLAWMSLALDYQIWGARPFGFHLSALAWHSASSVLLFFCLRKLFPRSPLWAVLSGTLFWAIHPLRVESVAWATERRDVLSGFFTLLAWWLYGHKKRGAVLAFAAGLLSKATAVGFIWLMAFRDYLRKKISVASVQEWAVNHWRYLFLAAAIGAVGLAGVHREGLFFRDYTLLERLGLFFHASTFYLQKAVLPVSLSPLYAIPLDLSVLKVDLVLRGVLWVLITCLCVRLRPRYGLLEKVWWTYLLILLPVSGLMQHGRQVAADRYTYIAFLPWSVLVVDVLTRIKMSVVKPAALAAGALLSFGTLSYCRVWKDDVSLWSRAVRVEPEGPIAQYNLGTSFLKTNQWLAARHHLHAALALWPQDQGIRLNLIITCLAAADDAMRNDKVQGGIALRKEALALAEGLSPDKRQALFGKIRPS